RIDRFGPCFHHHGALHLGGLRPGKAQDQQDHREGEHDDEYGLQCSHFQTDFGESCIDPIEIPTDRKKKWNLAPRLGMIFSKARTIKPHHSHMKTITRAILGALSLVIALSVVLPACKAKEGPAGTRVKQPFSGNKYESNNTWWRSTGQGASSKQNIARAKADSEARSQLASQIGTNMRAVSDQYLAQTENENARDVADKFQS